MRLLFSERAECSVCIIGGRPRNDWSAIDHHTMAPDPLGIDIGPFLTKKRFWMLCMNE